ncbi:receptor-interacting serine/threonine-protein kinase 3-like [Glandiceps talaboti]
MVVKVTDFTYLKSIESPEYACGGAVGYKSPEMFAKPPLAASTAKDIWALGCSMTEVICLELPWYSITITKHIEVMMASVLEGDKSTVPMNIELLEKGPFRELCELCCVMVPSDRPSALVVRDTLDEILKLTD